MNNKHQKLKQDLREYEEDLADARRAIKDSFRILAGNISDLKNDFDNAEYYEGKVKQAREHLEELEAWAITNAK